VNCWILLICVDLNMYGIELSCIMHSMPHYWSSCRSLAVMLCAVMLCAVPMCNQQNVSECAWCRVCLVLYWYTCILY